MLETSYYRRAVLCSDVYEDSSGYKCLDESLRVSYTKWQVLRVCSDDNLVPVPIPSDTAFIIQELSDNGQYLIVPTRFVNDVVLIV